MLLGLPAQAITGSSSPFLGRGAARRGSFPPVAPHGVGSVLDRFFKFSTGSPPPLALVGSPAGPSIPAYFCTSSDLALELAGAASALLFAAVRKHEGARGFYPEKAPHVPLSLCLRLPS